VARYDGLGICNYVEFTMKIRSNNYIS
jgi:hypothetical protein